MRIVVTGGAGFIGSHFVRTVLEQGYPGMGGGRVTGDAVVVLDAFTYAGRIENLDPVRDDPRLRVERGDIRDPQRVTEVLTGADLVVHCAAETHVDRSITGAADFVTTNVVGTQVLLQAALDLGVGRFVHVSTDEVYGSIEDGSWAETEPLEPNSPYSAAKAGSDLLVRSYHRTHGLDTVITRCSNNYGPHQFPEKVVPLFVTRLLLGRTVPLYGDGGNVRDWLHVDDHCRGIALAAATGRPGEIYNIGGGTELSNRELTGRLLAAVGAGEEMIERVPDRKGHDRRYAVDWSKIRDELGYAPRVPFEEGLASTVAWYRENRDWWEALQR
ncbi:dTDP-glucose 4,6-dehydratase [Pseudonocardia ammonioxydans]|uniref:dTDP-glucose 4,6-dehydratase n=1 Tax=Pseudonocardia ammonioxydans TaxID=260086 RepID=A0A1I5CHE7_PSUAM|nr:dTDP-glucose 4,6-dehydratase [Pseudonocardia ammonioxydans]SFN86333.1 dTDP-glucose 4,6-dehydratase [Pseudonocardia ammonioxydans]